MARLAGDGCGAAIHEEILRATERDVSIAAVYVTLSRLERKDLVSAGVALPGPDRGGRPRKTFDLTAAGIRELQRSRVIQDRLWSGLDFDALAAEE